MPNCEEFWNVEFEGVGVVETGDDDWKNSAVGVCERGRARAILLPAPNGNEPSFPDCEKSKFGVESIESNSKQINNNN